MKILIIVAHPDDEILGMGGTIKKFTKKKFDVKVVFLATGISARRSENYSNSTNYRVNEKTNSNMKKQIKALRGDVKKAMKILGVKDYQFEDFPDNEMDTVSNLEITKKIEKILFDFKPNIVYTHTQHDINVDHRAIYNATITATRPSKKSNIDEVITFEVPSSTEWYFNSNFSPNIFVDISSELSVKLKAMKAYKNEIHDFPHPRSLKALDAIATRWGSVSGFQAAEAFTLVRKLKKSF